MKFKQLILLVCVAVMLVMLAGCSKQQSVVSADITDVTGFWKGQASITDTDLFRKKSSSDSAQIEIILAQTGRGLSGKVIFGDKTAFVDEGFIVDKTIFLKAGPLNIEGTFNGNSIGGKIDAEYRSEGGFGSVHKLTGDIKVEK